MRLRFVYSEGTVLGGGGSTAQRHELEAFVEIPGDRVNHPFLVAAEMEFMRRFRDRDDLELLVYEVYSERGYRCSRREVFLPSASPAGVE